MLAPRTPTIPTLAVAAAVLCVAAPAAAESLEFIGDRHAAFADTYQFATVEHEFRLTNRGEREVTITDAFALSDDGQVRFDRQPIPPGGPTTVTVTQPVGDRLGTTSFRFALITDEPGSPRYRFSLSGFVQSAYDPEAVHLDLGFVDRRRGGTAQLELYSREVEHLRTAEVAADHPGFTIATEPAGLSGEGLRVRVTATPDLPRGLVFGTAVLETNVEHQPRFELSYAVNAFDDVVPAANPVAFGLVRAGTEAIETVEVRSRSGADFEIEHASSSLGDILEVSWRPCEGGDNRPSSCFEVRLSLSPEQPRITDGSAELYIVGDPEAVPIKISAWVIDPGTAVKQLDMGAPW